MISRLQAVIEILFLWRIKVVMSVELLDDKCFRITNEFYSQYLISIPADKWFPVPKLSVYNILDVALESDIQDPQL